MGLIFFTLSAPKMYFAQYYQLVGLIFVLEMVEITLIDLKPTLICLAFLLIKTGRFWF
jgi:hypothetical protein